MSESKVISAIRNAFPDEELFEMWFDGELSDAKSIISERYDRNTPYRHYLSTIADMDRDMLIETCEYYDLPRFIDSLLHFYKVVKL